MRAGACSAQYNKAITCLALAQLIINTLYWPSSPAAFNLCAGLDSGGPAALVPMPSALMSVAASLLPGL
jgi:hypothetical protein